jgi:hypothetical protein
MAMLATRIGVDTDVSLSVLPVAEDFVVVRRL